MTDDRTTRIGADARVSALLERGSRRRALCKALLYRVLMLVTTVIIALAVTGEASAAIDIGIAATVVKTGAYYGYERAWEAI